ncbi:methyl-accepting chemotaxis protein [Paenibacillus sp. GSMTC-2017]|uniref:methyl-accepting chemotaxis protein n=1 Tax=Paenibacillus sp. GSMTC-2017 TaxID=2794350 RepID=UPI0018D98B82|nr:HAMP domain-containing methyl-accepting chemotaxis protein [Paenibacillus sp. GSMTC-2017]MBH5319805.1 methyl-accepting chemotaxis protein [Paenibacillus sp. GSMTC-2017]
MLGLKNKSIVVTSSLLMATLLIVLIGSMESISYNAQKKTLNEELKHIGETLGYQLEFDYEFISKGYTELLTKKTSTAATFFVLKNKFDAMTRNDRITNAVMYMPELVEVNGKQQVMIMQSNEDMTANGFGVGKTYEMSEVFEKSFRTALEKGESWSEIYTDTMGQWVSYFKLIVNDKGQPVGVFSLDFDYKQVNKELSAMFWESIIIATVLSIIAILIIVILIRFTLKPLVRLAEVSKLAASGDLTVAVPVRNDNEIGKVSTSFNAMIASLRKVTAEIRRDSSEVASSASNMQLSAEQTSRATEEVTEAIQEVASGSETQLQSFQECQRAMGEMAIGIGRIAESTSSVSELAAETNVLATEGESVISDTLHHMQHIESNIGTTVATLQELTEQSDKIENILVLISEVANQTNLLALNASIEAARAGEHGKGFAVVAVEIRKLAERSKDSSEQIGQILNLISNKTAAAVSAMELSVSAARTGTSVTNQAGESFRTIKESIRHVASQVEEVSAAAEQMSAGSEQIAASLDELEHIAQSAAANSQRVAAASEEQLASMQEVASGSVQLRSLATSLNEAVGRFKT